MLKITINGPTDMKKMMCIFIVMYTSLISFSQSSVNIRGIHRGAGDSLEIVEVNYPLKTIKIRELQTKEVNERNIAWLDAIDLYPKDLKGFWQAKALKAGYFQNIQEKGYQYDLRTELEEDVLQYVQQLRQDGLIFNDSYLENYLYSLLYKLYPETAHDERQGLKSVLVVNDISPNAFMCPNGTILITTGLLSTINSEEELVASLAHEVAHYVLDHSIININKNLQRQKTALFWAGFATAVAASADVYMTATNEYYTPGALTQSTALLSFSIATLITERLGLKYSREQELEADQCATDLLKFLNLPPVALSSVLEKIKRYCITTGNHAALSGNGTHPNIDDRISKIGTPTRFTSIDYDGTISLVLTQNAIFEFNNAHFIVCQALVERSINAGTAIEDDYILKAITNLYRYNTLEKNSEALSLIQKAKNLNIVPSLNTYKYEALALIRLNKNADAVVAMNSYIMKLNEEANNLETVKSEAYWASRFVYLRNERDWASKMVQKLKSNNIKLN